MNLLKDRMPQIILISSLI